MTSRLSMRGGRPVQDVQNHPAFDDVAVHYFGTRDNLVVLPGVPLTDGGVFGSAIVRHQPFCCSIDDFVLVETWGSRTQNSPRLAVGLEKSTPVDFSSDFMNIVDRGRMAERLGSKLYCILLSSVWEHLARPRSVSVHEYNANYPIVLALCDSESNSPPEPKVVSFLSLVIGESLNGNCSNVQTPSRNEFMAQLRTRLEHEMGRSFAQVMKRVKLQCR